MNRSTCARPGIGSGRRDPERGSGTVLVLALVATAASGLVLVSFLAAAQAGRSAAQAAADLAALAVAERVAGGLAGAGSPAAAGDDDDPSRAEGELLAAACSVGRSTAESNGCRLTSCDAVGAGVVEVTTSRRTAAGVAHAVARAGPEGAR